MENSEGYCWLTNRIENIAKLQHFTRSIKTIQNFRLLWSNLLPNDKFSVDSFMKYYKIFTSELQDNWNIYSFNILKPSKTVKIQTKVSSDIKRTIGKHRTDHSLVNDKTLAVDTVMQLFSRMLVFIDKRITKYMQGYCDILMPIFHIFTQGLLAIYDSLDFTIGDSSIYTGNEYTEPVKTTYDYILTIASSCSCFAFQGLMINPINYIEQFPPNNHVEVSMNILKDRLKARHEFAPFMNQEDCVPSRFAAKWFLLLFTQDLKFSDTLELWCELVRTDSAFVAPTFVEKIIKACECAAICKYKNAGEKVVSHFIESMQQTQNLTFADMKKVALMLK